MRQFTTIATAAALTALLAGPALSEDVTIGSDGSLFCLDADEMTEIVKAVVAGKAPPPMKSCSVLPAGTKVSTVKTEELTKGVKIAVGIVQDGPMAKKPGVMILAGATAPAGAAEKPTSWGRTYKRVSASDVRNTPNKWSGRDLEFTNVNVYWVDNDDVRFITDKGVVVFASDVRGANADREFYKGGCETEAEAFSKKCRATIRFKYDRFQEDNPSPLMKRTVLQTADLEVIRPPRR